MTLLAVAPRCPQSASSPPAATGVHPAAAELRLLIQELSRASDYAAGTVLEFERSPDWRVRFTIDGRHVATFQTPELAWALFDAYVGDRGHCGAADKARVVAQLRAGQQ